MIDPMDALRKLQHALDHRIVHMQKCVLHPDMHVHLDHRIGKPRFTYALLRGSKVHAIALFAETDPIERTLCFNVGYACV